MYIKDMEMKLIPTNSSAYLTKKRWLQTMDEMNFTHSSRKIGLLLKKLGATQSLRR